MVGYNLKTLFHSGPERVNDCELRLFSTSSTPVFLDCGPQTRVIKTDLQVQRLNFIQQNSGFRRPIRRRNAGEEKLNSIKGICSRRHLKPEVVTCPIDANNIHYCVYIFLTSVLLVTRIFFLTEFLQLIKKIIIMTDCGSFQTHT